VPAPNPPNLCPANPLGVMDAWLDAIAADRSGAPLATKVARNKPSEAVDACWIRGEKITDESRCRSEYPSYGSPRMAAAGPLSNHIVKCRLKPLDRGDYNVTFSDEQWAALRAAFPGGVCDWSKPGVGEQPSVPWMSFAGGPGGRPLGRAPRSRPTRRCESRRRFRIRVSRVRGHHLRSAVVQVGTRRPTRMRRRGRGLVGTVDLRGLSGRTVRVRIVGRTRTGRRVVAVRRYRVCRNQRR
jgi:hypothetical protein